MFFLPLETIPVEAFQNTWVIEERNKEFGVKLSEEEYNLLIIRYIWVKTKEIDVNLRFYLDTVNSFKVNGESWEVIKKETYEIIQSLQNKVEFQFDLLPQVIKNIQTWDIILRDGVRIIYIDQPLYHYLVKSFVWKPIESVPAIHRNKGEIVEEHNLIILKKTLLITIYRHLNNRG